MVFVTDISGITSNFSGIRPSTSLALSRKIAMVQQARAASAAAQAASSANANIIQPSSSTSEPGSALVKQVTVSPGTQKTSSRENTLNR